MLSRHIPKSEINYPAIRAAIERDDLSSLSNLLSLYPQPILWNPNDNPLITASFHGSRRVAQKLAGDYPELLQAKDKDGQTPLHVACPGGHLQIVKLFVKLDRKLFLTKDRFLRIPLHLAVEHGFVEVVKELVEACPQSIKVVTSSRETVFHLAVKNHRSETFCELLQLALHLNRQKLLHRKDRQGDSVLHIAVSNKLTQVIVKLLDAQNPTGKALVRVNTMNRNRLTALDVYYQSNNINSTQNIGRILEDAGGLKSGSLTTRGQIRPNLEAKNVILVWLSVMAGAAFTTVCNLPSSFTIEGENQTSGLEYEARDVITARLPSVFYLMVFNSAVLLACLVAMGVLLWSLPLQPVVVFSTVAIGVVYAILVKNVMPKMSVRVGNGSIQGSALVGLLAVGCVCFGAVLYYGCKGFKWVVSKTAQEFDQLLLPERV